MKLSKILLSLPALGAFFLWFTHGTDLQASQISVEDAIHLEAQATASLVQTAPSYAEQSTFLSEIYETDHSFQLIGLHWMEDIPEETAAHLEIRFRTAAGMWTPWKDLHEDHDKPAEEDGQWSYVITQESDAFQYRVQMSTNDALVTPKLSDMTFDVVNGGQLSPAKQLSRVVFHDSNPHVISRSEWGANETYGLASTFGGDDGDDDLEDPSPEFPDEEVSRIVKTDAQGRELVWPQAYPSQGPSKIIIHHTATTDDLDDPEAAIRAIHYYHSISRGWGDIGYNYIVAPDGRVFQGRAGDPGVVGGHAAGFNTGSVGIVLLGNYQEEPIPADMMQGLMGTIYDVALMHDIDPDGYSIFRGQMMPNLFGHRDVSATACPGEVTYDYMSALRTTIGDSLDEGRRVNGSDLFAFEEVLERPLITLLPAEDSERVKVEVKNTGSRTWNDDTFLTVNGIDEILHFDKNSKKSIAEMEEDSVEPGETATFIFDVESDWKGGLVNRDLAIIFNGNQKNEHTMDLTVFVEDPILAFKLKDVDAPTTLQPGQKEDVTVKIENTGNIPWFNSGDYEVELKKKGGSTLTSKTILASLKEKEVQPGEVGTFEFEVTGGLQSKASLEFELEVNGVDAISKGSGRITIRSTGTTEDAVIKDHAELNFVSGEERLFWVKITNTSTEAWKTSGDNAFNLDIDKPSNIEVGSVHTRLRTINPGISTMVYFDLTMPEEGGSYDIDVTPRLGAEELMDPYTLTLEVSDVIDYETSEEDIRIKLTPDNESETHIITSDTAFVLYENDKALKSFGANSFVRITPQDGVMFVRVGSYNHFTTEPIRVAPVSEDGIVSILTMEQRPGWNPSLNDNQYRGSIEGRLIDGEFTLINEVPLEDYVKGIGEVSNDTHPEKVKTILVLARTYAYYYMTSAEKFPGMPYHLDDTPEASQKYLGYGFELRSTNVAELAEATAGMMVTYNGSLVNRPTPYFTQTDGTSTKSAQEVWGWTDTPWLVSVSDSHCNASTALGHQVGLSGCGADAMAQEGKGYEEIIQYYYTGVEVEKLL